MDVDDYCKFHISERLVTHSGGDVTTEAPSIETGFTHVSVARLNLKIDGMREKKVGYIDGNIFNMTKSNLYVIED